MKFKSFLIAASMMLLLFLIGFFGVNIIMKLFVGHEDEVKVPNLIGMNFDVARKNCSDLKLYLKQTDAQNSDEYAKGKIINQSPHQDIMTKAGRTIEVVVSLGSELMKVPYLDSITETEAEVRLSNAGLKIGKKEQRYNDKIEAGKIIYSVPAADELVPKGSKVNIVVSLGKVPDSPDKDRWKNLLDKAGEKEEETENDENYDDN